MKGQQRLLGFDVHREYVVIAAVNAQQEIVLEPRKVWFKQLPKWMAAHLLATDRVALEATSNAWPIYDQLVPVVSEVLVANPYKIKLISSSRTKTDRHDALVLAKLLAANLLPAVWVPPAEVRELRSLIAHRQHLVRDRTATKNRLHSVLHRHNLHLPVGDPFNDTNKSWWQALSLSRAERLRVRHELVHIQHLSTLLTEVEAEIAHLSLEAPWQDQLTFLIQLPGIGLLSGMTILSAIGEIGRFPTARNLVGYSGLGSSVHDSGKTHRAGPITKQGRRELRTVLVECAWSAVRYSPFWQATFERLAYRIGKQKAIVAVARKLLVVIWHVLAKRQPDRRADPQAVARSLMKWASCHRWRTTPGLSRSAFVWGELDRLGLGKQMDFFIYCGRQYARPPA